MKQKFREVSLNRTNKERLMVINDIIEEYQEQGYVLTLRQLYYQLVSRDVVPNKVAEYAKLSTLLKEGRMGGIVDWSAIEDRLRKPNKPSAWDSPRDILEACSSQFQLPRQEGQNIHLEVWVEKDALSGVLSRVTKKYHVPIMVNRGYSSVSAMYESYMRFATANEEGKKIKILYLGDYDPSGLDMIQDIKKRIEEFSVGDDMDFTIQPIALTRQQIRTYNPPPNPAKMTDPRAAKFVDAHGFSSWEVDALKPEVLHRTLEEAIINEIDMEQYQSVVELEQEGKDKLFSLIKYL